MISIFFFFFLIISTVSSTPSPPVADTSLSIADVASIFTSVGMIVNLVLTFFIHMRLRSDCCGGSFDMYPVDVKSKEEIV